MKRRGHPRIDIKDPHDVECIMQDMFDEFLEDLITKPWATREVNDDDIECCSEYEEYTYIYTRRGQQIVETYIRRMGELWEKVFPEELELDLKSHYFREP